MGEITNWKSLGGPDMAINIYAGKRLRERLGVFSSLLNAG